MKYKLLLIFGLFLILFPPQLKIYGIVFKILYISVVTTSFFGAIYYFKKKQKNISGQIFTNLIIILLYNIAFNVIFAIGDYSLLGQIFLGFISFFAAYFYVDKYYKVYGENFFNKITRDLFICGILHSIIVIIVVFIPAFKEQLYSIIYTTELQTRYLGEDIGFSRVSGLMPTGFSALSTIHGVLSLFGFFYLISCKNKKNYRDIILVAIGQTSIIISIVFIGRTGLLLTVLFGICITLYIIFSKNIKKIIKINIKRYTEFFTIIAIILLAIFDIKESGNYQFEFETLINLMRDGTLDKSSELILDTQYFLPDSLLQIIFGNGNYGRQEFLPITESDVGYVIFIHGGGILGLLISYSFILVTFIKSWRMRNKDTAIYLAGTTLCLVIILINFKDFYYFGYSDIFLILFIVICCMSKISELNKKGAK